MTDYRQLTIDTYNKSAKELAEYFRGIGSRVEDIERALHLAGSPKNAKVLEIGCGDGRDAKEIVKRVKSYTGFDISKELIKLAKAHVPTASFQVADAVNYVYPVGLDVVFAFASLLHLNKEEIRDVLLKVHKSLEPNGILYISLKYSPEYKEVVKEDQYGKRMFYFYYPELIQEIAQGYEVAFVKQDGSYTTTHNTKWFDIALRKKGV